MLESLLPRDELLRVRELTSNSKAIEEAYF